MKAILVIEMPSNCKNCLFCGFGGRNNELNVCSLTGKNGTSEKLDCCPLKPMLQKREPKKEWLNEYHRDEFADGWNACLEEIEG